MIEVREITEFYRLEKVLRSSTGGVVFRAVDPRSGGKVAIKLINRGPSPDQEACQEAFIDAVRAVKSLSLRCLPAILDFGMTPDGTAFLVLAFAEAEPIDTLIGAEAPRLLSLFGELADDLEQLAARGLGHLNLSPENIGVVREAGSERLVLFGFGTSAFRPERSPAQAEFAAPEQSAPGERVDWRADVYSLHLILCRLLRVEIRPDLAAPELLIPDPAVSGLADVDVLRSLLQHCLLRNPEQRPTSFAEIRQALGAAIGRAPASDERTRAFDLASLVPATPPIGEAALIHPAPMPASEPTPAREARPTIEATTRLAFDTQSVSPAKVDRTMRLSVPQPPPEPPERTRSPELDTKPLRIDQVTAVLPAIAEEGSRPTAIVAPPDGADASAPSSSLEEASSAAVSLLEAPPTSLEPAREPDGLEVEDRSGAEPGDDAPGLPFVATEAAALGLEHESAVLGTETEIASSESGAALAAPAPAAEVALPEPDLSAEATAATAAAEVPSLPPAVPAPAGAPRRPPAKPRTASRRVPLALAAAAALVLLVAAAGWWLAGRRPAPPPVAVVATPALPRPTAVPVPTPLSAAAVALAAAEEAAARGDLVAAGESLAVLSPADRAALSGEELSRLESLQGELDRRRQEDVARALDRGLRSGNLDVVRRAVASIGRMDAADLPSDAAFKEQLRQARAALEVQSRVAAAEREGNQLDVVRAAGELLALVPRSSQAPAARDKAAAIIEADADALVRAGRSQEAIARLRELQAAWPERQGLGRRVDALAGALEAERRMAALLGQLAAAEEEKRPERGLDLLANVSPAVAGDPRIAAAGERLRQQLAALDVQAPVVRLKPGVKLEYEKGKPALLQLRVTDDHGVKGVTALARREGAQYKPMQVRNTGPDEYLIEVPADVHGNETLELVVAATDSSGHIGRLGSEEAPVKVKRKRLLF